MKFRTITFNLATSKPIEIVDLTNQAKEFTENSGLKNGIVIVSTQHTTMAVKINENCENLLQDIEAYFGKIAPANDPYLHNIYTKDGRPNAHSHLLSLLLSSHELLPFSDGKLTLGQWQSIFAIELDGPRPERKISFTLIGE